MRSAPLDWWIKRLDRFGLHLAGWLLLGPVAAIPGFLLLMQCGHHTLLTAVALLLTVLVLAALSSSDRAAELLARPYAALAMRWAGLFRLAASLLVPIGMALDAAAHVWSEHLVEQLTGTSLGRRGELPSFFTALLQWWLTVGGTLLLTVLLRQGALRLWPLPPPEGICRQCGYDLRATPTRCPECGLPVHPAEVSLVNDNG